MTGRSHLCVSKIQRGVYSVFNKSRLLSSTKHCIFHMQLVASNLTTTSHHKYTHGLLMKTLLIQAPNHHNNRFTALFPGPPGWASARRELLDFMVQMKINRGRHTDHPAGCHSIRTRHGPCPPPPFYTGWMPYLPPNQQCQSIEGKF